MVLLHHEVEVEYPDGQPTEKHKATLLEFGKVENGRSTTAMALTVGVPAAIGALVVNRSAVIVAFAYIRMKKQKHRENTVFMYSRTMLCCSYCYRARSRRKEWLGLYNRKSTFQVSGFHACPCRITMTCNSTDSCICVCEALEILESSGIKLVERVEIWKLQVTDI